MFCCDQVLSFDGKARARDAIGKIEGLASVFLEPAFFYHNFQTHTPVQRAADGHGVSFELALPAACQLHMVDVAQVGDAVRAVLQSPAPFVGRCVPLIGDALSGAAVAAAFQRTTGVRAVYREVPDKELRETVQRARCADDIVAMFAFLRRCGWFGQLQHDARAPVGDAAAVREATKRDVLAKAPIPMRSFEAWLKSTAWTGDASA